MMTRFFSASTRATSRSMVVLPTPGRPSSSMLLPALDDVFDDLDRAVDGPAHAAGQADDAPFAVADGGDAVQRARDAGPVVIAEIADAGDHVIYLWLGDVPVTQRHFMVKKPGFRLSSQIQNHFQKLCALVGCSQGRLDVGWQNVQQCF